MERPFKPIPIQTFKRLPDYYSLLARMHDQGETNVSSTTIAGILKLNDVVVRKDLATVGENGGRPRTGYVVSVLMKQIGDSLGYYNTNDAVLIGAGQLGRALLSYDGFSEYGLKILAAFDIDESVVGLEKNGKPVMHISELAHFCKRIGVRIGIITTPKDQAQSICDLLVSSGVRAIWNFAHTHLTVPEDVFVHNENMALSLSLLSQHLAQKDVDD